MEALSPLDPKAQETYVPGTRGSRRGQNRQVCKCGHSIGHHSWVEDKQTYKCKAGNTPCLCRTPVPVLEVQNLRHFMYTTTDVGAGHALGRGMVATRANDKTFKWVEEHPKCDKCQEYLSAERLPFPVAISKLEMKPTNHSTGVDIVICVECYNTWE